MATQYEIDLALMAGRAYQSTRVDINWFPVPDGWTEMQHKEGDSGFEAIAFFNGSDLDQSTEIVISFAGTYDKDDIAADVGLADGWGSVQLLQAAEYFLQIKAQVTAANPNATITLTGHSLGGGLAALIGVFFGVKAVTFDQAPFANSAEENLLTPDVAANLKSDLLLAGYSEQDLAGLTSFLQLREDNGGIPNSNLVTNIRVDGEFLSSAPLGSFDIIGTTTTVLDHGPYSDPSIDMHSIALLTAFLQSEQSAANSDKPQQTLSEVTKKLTGLLGMFFEEQLFTHSTDPNSTEVNFLEHLVRHQEGADPTVPNDGDDMLTRFTADMWKIAQDGGLSLTDTNIAKALTAFAMQAYYGNRLAAEETLFESVDGGIRFNRADVANTLDGETDGAIGYKGTDMNKMFTAYLDSLTYGSAKTAMTQRLPELLDWYIQAGSQGLNAMAGTERAFMLGGSGVDHLIGGSQADVLVGNQGRDILFGGDGDDVLLVGWKSDGFTDSEGDVLNGEAGNDELYGGYGADTLIGGADADLMIGNTGIDTYYIEGNDTIVDSGRNSIYVMDEEQKYQLLAGGFVQEEGTSIYRSLSDGTVTLTFHSPGHLVLNGTDSITFANQTSAADFENGDFGITLFDSVSADRILTGTDGDDVTGAVALIGEARYYFSGTVSGDQPDDDLYPGWGEFTLTGDVPPNLSIDGGAGNDMLYGLAGSDFINGGSGNDVIFGETEWSSDYPAEYALLNPWGKTGMTDILQGESGKDVIFAGLGDDAVSGGDDDDFLGGGDGDDTVGGDGGNDVVTGSNGDDSLFGGDGNDLLYGDGALSISWFSPADITTEHTEITEKYFLLQSVLGSVLSVVHQFL